MHNEEHFSEINIQPPSTDFIMLPPTIDATTIGDEDQQPALGTTGGGRIQFEPLPNVSALRRSSTPQVAAPRVGSSSSLVRMSPTHSNLSQLRPRIQQIGNERFVDNDEEIEYLSGDDATTVQDRVRLEKLLR